MPVPEGYPVIQAQSTHGGYMPVCDKLMQTADGQAVADYNG